MSAAARTPGELGTVIIGAGFYGIAAAIELRALVRGGHSPTNAVGSSA